MVITILYSLIDEFAEKRSRPFLVVFAGMVAYDEGEDEESGEDEVHVRLGEEEVVCEEEERDEG